MCLKGQHMHIVTKFLWLKSPVVLGDQIDAWQVCWIGGWDRCRVALLLSPTRVMDVVDRGDYRVRRIQMTTSIAETQETAQATATAEEPKATLDCRDLPAATHDSRGRSRSS